MWKILLEEWYGDLKTQKTRAALTLFAITWGTIAVVLLLAFGEGLKRTAVEGLLSAGERIFLIRGGSTSKLYQGLPQGRSIRLSEEDLDLLQRSIPQLDLTSISYGRGGTSLKVGENRTTTYMEGVYPAFGEMRHMFPAPGGRFLNQRDQDQKRRVVFLGNKIAERLFGSQNPVGHAVTLDGLPFVVVGVMRPKFQDSYSNGPDEDRAVIPASTFQAIYGLEYSDLQLIVRPRVVAEARMVKQQLYQVLGRRHRFDPADQRALSIWDFIEDQQETEKIGLGIQMFLGLVGGFTLLVAGVGVANIMYVVVRERTREIGIKKAVGARRGHIVAQFVGEALLITLVGGLAGLTVAALVVLAVDAIPTGGNLAMEYLANPTLSWPIAAICAGILVGVGLAAGTLPARRAAAVDPVESLRYE